MRAPEQPRRQKKQKSETPRSRQEFVAPDPPRQLFPRGLRPRLDRISAHKASEVLRERFRRPIPIPRVLPQALENDRLKVVWHTRVDLPWLDWIPFDNLRQRVGVVPTTERRPTADRLVHRRAEGVDVGAMVHRNPLSSRLLGRHV